MDLALAIDSGPMAKKDPAAQSLGRRGGKARARSLTDTELEEIGRKGGQSRWKGVPIEERRRLLKKATAASAKARKKKKRAKATRK